MPIKTLKNWNDFIIFYYEKNLEISFQNGLEHETKSITNHFFIILKKFINFSESMSPKKMSYVYQNIVFVCDIECCYKNLSKIPNITFIFRNFQKISKT